MNKDRTGTFFREHGYVWARGVFSTSYMERICAETDRLMESPYVRPWNLRCRWQKNDPPGGRLEALDPVIDISPPLGQIVACTEITSYLEAIVGEKVHVLKDKLIYKMPGSQGYPLHQDFIDWEEFPEDTVQALVAIDGSDEATGSLEVFPGYHRQGRFPLGDELVFAMNSQWCEGKASRMLHLNQGDVLFFHAMLPHRSAPNRAVVPRRHLYLSYHRASEGDWRERYYQRHFAWSKAHLTRSGSPAFFH